MQRIMVSISSDHGLPEDITAVSIHIYIYIYNLKLWMCILWCWYFSIHLCRCFPPPFRSPCFVSPLPWSKTNFRSEDSRSVTVPSYAKKRRYFPISYGIAEEFLLDRYKCRWKHTPHTHLYITDKRHTRQSLFLALGVSSPHSPPQS